MNLSKLLLLAVIMTATGLVILPNTVSLFAGQHYWYNISGPGNQIPCEKCHADVFEELSQCNFHIHWGDPTKADRQDCAACHRSNLSIQYALVSGSYKNYQPGKQAHAASVVACMLCHQINASQASRVPGPYAGGFNVTVFGVSSPYNYSNSTYTGICEAHNAFVSYAISKANNSSLMMDSTEACLACHADVDVRMAFNISTGIDVYAKDVVLGYNPATGINESQVNVTGVTITDFKNVVEVKP